MPYSFKVAALACGIVKDDATAAAAAVRRRKNNVVSRNERQRGNHWREWGKGGVHMHVRTFI